VDGRRRQWPSPPNPGKIQASLPRPDEAPLLQQTLREIKALDCINSAPVVLRIEKL
jgi:hypothetical protein